MECESDSRDDYSYDPVEEVTRERNVTGPISNQQKTSLRKFLGIVEISLAIGIIEC